MKNKFLLLSLFSFAFIFTSFAQNYDLSTSLKINDKAKLNSEVIIQAEVTNHGTQEINYFDINYKIDNGATITERINSNLKPKETKEFSLSKSWKPEKAAQLYDISAWATNINGYSDENSSNDVSSKNVFVNHGITTTKRVLFEQITEVKNGQSTDGLAKLIDLKAVYGDDLIIINIHKNDDIKLFTFEGNDIMNTLGGTIPSGIIDREKWTGFDHVGIPRDNWTTKVAERMALSAPVEVKIDKITVNNLDVSIDVSIDFVDDVIGDIRVNCVIVENYVMGKGVNYDQVNAYNNVYGHHFYGLGNPIVDFPHQRVVRRFFTTGAWGDVMSIDSFFPPHIYEIGTKYSKTFDRQMYVGPNPNQLWAVVFVSKYDYQGIDDYEVLNVTHKKLNNVSVEENSMINDVSEIYPNPVNDIGRISFKIKNTETVSLEIFNPLGQKVKQYATKTYSAGKQNYYFNVAELDKGIYLAKLKIGNKIYVKNFIK